MFLCNWQTIRKPTRILEVVLVIIDMFYFPMDFIILDMDGDNVVPLIFGRPFLAISYSLTDVQGGRLTFKVGKEAAIFNILKKPTPYPTDEWCNEIELKYSKLVDKWKKANGKNVVSSLKGCFDGGGNQQVDLN